VSYSQGPTLAGFTSWIYSAMGITTADLPTNSPWIGYAYNDALDIVNLFINRVSPLQYTLAVYNLGGDNLINYAQDVPPSTFFYDTRRAMNITAFVPGVVSNTSDQGTGAGILNTEAMKTFTLANLQNLKTVWGRAYLAIAQRTGTVWGVA